MVKIQDLEKFESVKERQLRYFSESFKKKKVKEIEGKLTSVREICREYAVSKTAVYKWIYKYSDKMKKGVRQIVEESSDTKKLQLLKEQIKELERIIGQKQLKVDFLEKVIELTEEEYGIDIKKKYGNKPPYGSGDTGKNTSTR